MDKPNNEWLEKILKPILEGFNMDSLLDLRSTYTYAADPISNSSIVIDMLDGIYHQVLARKLGYSDMVIKTILHQAYTKDGIQNIYVFDDNVVIETTDHKQTIYPRLGLVDITSDSFYVGDAKIVETLIVKTINLQIGELLEFKDNKINYLDDDTVIYCNCSFNELKEFIAKQEIDKIKFLVKADDFISYYSLEKKDGFIKLNKCEYAPDSLAEKLGEGNHK